jgi:ribosome-associated toxin RatA of RatAB toxin-antitoxin module
METNSTTETNASVHTAPNTGSATTKFTQFRTIQAPADRVWAKLADFGGVHLFHPIVESSPILNGQDTGLGAQRRCDLYNGAEVFEEVTSFNPQRRNLEITVLEPSGPIEAMTGQLTVTPRGDNSCEVRADMEYSLEAGAEVDGLRAMMEGAVESMLKGLDDHAVTGALIGEGGKNLSTPFTATA